MAYSPHKGLVMQSFDVFFVVSLNKLLNIELCQLPMISDTVVMNSNVQHFLVWNLLYKKVYLFIMAVFQMLLMGTNFQVTIATW